MEFPITYLGMPLTIRRPRRCDYMPLIEKIEKRLDGWKGKLLSRGGRLFLQNSVLASIPIYHMTCFVLPKWVLNRIDRIRRGFLWGRSAAHANGIPLLNWTMVCMPKIMGGLGASNLEVRNISLILRWWWKVQAQPNSLWASTALVLRGTYIQSDGPQIWAVSGSFFWRILIKLKHFYHWSTLWEVDQGTSISFWFDSWAGLPFRDLRDGQPRPPLQRISLRDALPITQNIAPLVEFENPQLTNQQDVLRWRWSNSGQYTASSFYKAVLKGGRIQWHFAYTWNCYAPLKVKIFTLLLLTDRILTHDVMAKRGFHCDLHCALCNSCQLETANHIMFSCQYARTVWEEIQRNCDTQILVIGESVQQTWDCTWLQVKAQGKLSKKDWATRFMCAAWMIWRQRNEKVFNDKAMPPTLLAKLIIQESDLWMRYCRSSINRSGIG